MDTDYTPDAPSSDAAAQLARVDSVTLSPLLQTAINASLWENSVPVLGELSLKNEGDRELELVEISVNSEPPFLVPRSWRLQQVAPGQLRLVNNLDVKLDGTLVASQTEASRATVTFVATAEGIELARETRDVRVLARNEWGGLSGIPDILAAFVLPNDPAIARILKLASDVLRAAGQSPALEGYQGDKARVWAQAQAIWNAICGLDISYINPPASFVETGQRIRLPSQILEERLATCLDTTVLFAACLEAIGLRSLIVLTKGHAFAGFWLSMVDAGSSVLNDLPGIRNRLKLDDLRVFETTMATLARKPSFKVACEHGEAKLRQPDDDEEESDFREIIDVHRARLRRILPLSTVSAAPTGDGDAASDGAASEQPQFEAPPALREDSEETDVPETPADRVQRWCNRLLDMSARNRLLNLPRSDRQLIEIDCPDPAALEDMLAEMRGGGRSKPLRFAPSPGLMDKDDPRHRDIHRDRHHEDAARAFAMEALSRRELLIWRKEGPLQDALTEIFRQARAAEQEGGTNVLYLTIGALAWTPQDKAKAYVAPLILVPVILERASVKSAFTLRAHGDESRINSTLLEMLRSDYDIRMPSLEGPTLPEDESGLDVRGIIETFRVHLRHVPGWEVREHVSLTTLSFAKFLMWKDLLERRDNLRTNDVAGRLLDGVTGDRASSDRAPGSLFTAGDDLDDALAKADLVCPMEADSSQLQAVARAAKGESFVLIGPPGTGKSQTIANIVANTLAQGRTVLFVAEKRTALEVVRTRLAKLGIADFCLDLFSPKASKLAVLEQFQAAQNVLESFSPGEYDRTKRNFDEIRTELNAYVRDLHRRSRNGWIPYRGIGVSLRAEKAGTVRVPLSWHSADAHDVGAYQRLVEASENLATLYERIGDVVTSPRLAGLDHADWSPLWESRLLEAVGAALSSLAALKTAALDVTSALGIGAEDLSLVRLRHVDALCTQLLRAEADAWAFGDTAQQSRDAVFLERKHVVRHCELKAAVGQRWKDSVTSLPLDEILGEWRAAKERWLLARPKAQKAVRARLEPHALAVPDDPENDLVQLIEMKAIEQRLRDATHGAAVGGLWQGLATDFPRIDEVLGWGGAARTAVSACVKETTALLAARGHLKTMLAEGRDLLREGGSVHAALVGYREALTSCLTAIEKLGAASGSDATALADPKAPDWIDLTIDRLQDWKGAARELRDWCSWRHASKQASELGLKPLVDAIEQGLVSPRDVPSVFEANYARWWTMHAVSDSQLLRGFVAATHEGRIARFKEIDERLKGLAVSLIRARLAGQIPDAASRQNDPEYKLLTREMAKKARHLPVRQLAEKMPKALRTLTPCLMMSPLSVAQYLPADAEPFDLVIFDEASQIPTWDAVGAIGRGKQVIVVGDPKQLPPTDFFARGKAADDEDDSGPTDMADLDSILDECLGAGIPAITLAWHYRSRHESLIAFSNQAYYGGGLVTFPSPVTSDQAVSFRFVPDGVYERGGSRTNPVEVRAVVAEALKIMRDGSDRSIGIVTFNGEQQKRISDALEAEGRKDPSLERYLGERAHEPILVRNLESIQGEERDVMLFSLTFGPDKTGAISVNFGPLNRDGGERRLNVAVTRAREQLVVFGSLRGDQIAVGRTQALGVHDLRRFLTFAEHGAMALAGLHQGSVGDFDSVFEVEVAERLREKGWQVVTQVGVSGFRIDLGVVDPELPTTFLAGVECDGATYHRSATARDRDRLRQVVLEGLGWNILRIWSTDWWTNAPRETMRVDQALRALLVKAREERAKRDEKDRLAAEAAVEASLAAGSSVESQLEDDVLQASVDVVEVPKDEILIPTPAAEPAYAKAPLEEFVAADAQAAPAAVQARFFDVSYLPTLTEIVLRTLREAGPIREDILVQTVSRLHGFGRTGKDIRERIVQTVSPSVVRTTEDVGTFLWPEGTSPEGDVPFRRPAPGEAVDPGAIPLPALIRLARSFPINDLSDEDIVVGMRNACGMGRMGAATRARLEAALAKARSERA